MKDLILVAIVTFIVIFGPFMYPITQQYWYNNIKTTATKGIIFTKTLDMSLYTKVGEGSGLLGNYDEVTRSPMHESMRVYH